MKKTLKTIDVILGILVSVALINWGSVFWFNFNIVEFITFGISWLSGTIYTIVAVIGTIWVISAVSRLLMKLR